MSDKVETVRVEILTDNVCSWDKHTDGEFKGEFVNKFYKRGQIVDCPVDKLPNLKNVVRKMVLSVEDAPDLGSVEEEVKKESVKRVVKKV